MSSVAEEPDDVPPLRQPPQTFSTRLSQSSRFDFVDWACFSCGSHDRKVDTHLCDLDDLPHEPFRGLEPRHLDRAVSGIDRYIMP